MSFTEKQKEILDISITMFSERGYKETSMRDIASKFNVKAASLYSHFISKEEILKSICEIIYKQMTDNVNFIKNSEASSEEKFLTSIKLHIETLVTFGREFGIYQKYWSVINEKEQRKYGVLNFEYFAFVNKLVKEFLPNEVEKDCFVPNSTTLFILDMLNNVPRMINPKNPDIERVVEDIQYRLINGFKNDMKK